MPDEAQRQWVRPVLQAYRGGVGNAVGHRQIEDFHHAAALRKGRAGCSTTATSAAEIAALSKRRRSRISEGANMRNAWSRARLPSTRVWTAWMSSPKWCLNLTS